MDYNKLKSLIEKEVIVHETKDGASCFRLSNEGMLYKLSITICTADPSFYLYHRHDSPHLFSVLAHEFGHYLSWKKELRPKILDVIMSSNRKKSPIDNNIIYEEEAIAWRQGELFAKNNGFQLTSQFYSIKRKALKSYEN